MLENHTNFENESNPCTDNKVNQNGQATPEMNEIFPNAVNEDTTNMPVPPEKDEIIPTEDNVHLVNGENPKEDNSLNQNEQVMPEMNEISANAVNDNTANMPVPPEKNEITPTEDNVHLVNGENPKEDNSLNQNEQAAPETNEILPDETAQSEPEKLADETPQESAYGQMPYWPISQETIRPARRRKKPKKRMALAAALVAVCMMGSAAFGFGGTYLANNLKQTETSGTSTGNTVIYQSVIKTDSTGESTKELSIADVVSTVKESVVEITTEIVTKNSMMGQMVSTGAGSGVIISTDGYIVTNNHVIDGASTITVRLSDEKDYKATLVGTDSKTDLAVIKINKTGLKPAVLGSSSSLAVGQTAVAIGNPLGELGGTVTQGIISALDREITIDGETMSLLQTDTAINPGNSGGGLFNLYGELVGIVNAKSSGSDIEGLGFAIPIDTAKTIIEQIIENGYVKGRIDTGLTLVDIQDTQTAMTYRVNALGLYISKSSSSSFQSGDIITAVGGKTVSNLETFNQIMSGYKPGDTVKITVTRSGSSMTNSLTLGELKT